MLQRFEASKGCSLRIKNTSSSTQNFTDMVNAVDFKSKIDRCVAQPESSEARALGQRIATLIKLSGSRVPWSAMERAAALPRILSMIMFFGPPAYFVTISPSDNDSAILLKIASFGEAGGGDIQRSFPLPTVNKRRQKLATNPVAAALVYRTMCQCVFEELVGLPSG